MVLCWEKGRRMHLSGDGCLILKGGGENFFRLYSFT